MHWSKSALAGQTRIAGCLAGYAEPILRRPVLGLDAGLLPLLRRRHLYCVFGGYIEPDRQDGKAAIVAGGGRFDSAAVHLVLSFGHHQCDAASRKGLLPVVLNAGRDGCLLPVIRR